MTDIFQSLAANCVVHESGWHQLDDDIEIVRIPLIDVSEVLPDGRPMFGRLSHNEQEKVCTRLGAEFVTMALAKKALEIGVRLRPVQLASSAEDTKHMRGLTFCRTHDTRVWGQLEAIGWDGSEPVGNIGKFWLKPDSKNARNGGWFKPDGSATQPGGPGSEHHDRNYGDYSQLGYIIRRRARKTFSFGDSFSKVGAWFSGLFGGSEVKAEESKVARSTIRSGSRGADVEAWQRIVGVGVDGVFGATTERATKRWQELYGLVPDGIVGAKSWHAAGYEGGLTPSPTEAPKGHDPRAPACVAAIRDANAAWPSRSRVSDGIMGDVSHQARPSDHNLGNAVDVTHDPVHGCDGEVVARMAIQDPRCSYVIWNKRIFNRARAAEEWRPYTGSNSHTHHVHISVRVDARGDASRWPWAP